ncbi:MAG: hypothetical protein IJI66_02885 [Erysipelotrichaceae bacterium]|nr:hypothetical protein [Erysipelotrichaceae bacterium]
MIKDYTFDSCAQFIQRKELIKKYSSYLINTFVTNGYLTKINNRYYQNNRYEGEESDFYYVAAYVPNGVIGFMSAAVYYGLSNYRPASIDVVVKANSYVSPFPNWPPIDLHYMEEKYYDFAITSVNENGNVFKIYEPEKVVSDIVKYRESIGIEETKEVLTNYLKRPDRDIGKLMKYAKRMRCEKQMKTYMEVLV